MNRLPATLPLFAALLASFAAAQNHIVVSAGGGGAYTDIASAIAAAQPGDSVIVRPGSYAGFTLSKAISILGQPGAQIAAPGAQLETITVSGVPAGTQSVVAGLELRPGLLIGLRVQDCPGRVLIDRVVDNIGGNATGQVKNCAQVFLSQCTFAGLSVNNSAVSAVDCSTSGRTVLAFGIAGLTVQNATLWLSRCHVTGGNGPVPAPAIEMSNSSLTVTDDGSGSIAAGTGGTAPTAAISGTGTLAIDDDVPLVPSNGGPQVAASIATTMHNIPSMFANSAAIGGQMTLDLFSEPQDTFVLILGALGDRLSLPIFKTEFWLHPATLVVVLAGALDNSGRVNLQLQIMNNPLLIGFPLAWQAAAGPLPNLVFSNPAAFVLWQP
jgi:hypothetical protein